MPLLRALMILAVASTTSFAQGVVPFKVEILNQGPPAALSDAIRAELGTMGYRVIDGRGKPYADVWLRKVMPATARPSGPAGRVQFPILADGTLLGAVRYEGDGQDFRDQTIAPGVYTLRYGLQPQGGPHARVSPFRDFALLLPALDDTIPSNLARKPLEEKSADAAGSSHPAVLTLLAAEATGPTVVEDKRKGTWGLVVPLALAVKGEAAPVAMPVQIIVSGAVAAF